MFTRMYSGIEELQCIRSVIMHVAGYRIVPGLMYRSAVLPTAALERSSRSGMAVGVCLDACQAIAH